MKGKDRNKAYDEQYLFALSLFQFYESKHCLRRFSYHFVNMWCIHLIHGVHHIIAFKTIRQQRINDNVRMPYTCRSHNERYTRINLLDPNGIVSFVVFPLIFRQMHRVLLRWWDLGRLYAAKSTIIEIRLRSMCIHFLCSWCVCMNGIGWIDYNSLPTRMLKHLRSNTKTNVWQLVNKYGDWVWSINQHRTNM